MKLVAIARAPTRPDEAARAVTDATGLTLAEARMRLAREPPALLARLESDKASILVAALRKAGLAALAVDARCPNDKDRAVAHTFILDDSGVTFTPRVGDPMGVEWHDVLAILRGLRASRSEVERTEKSKSFSVGTAVATGGLRMTRTSVKTVRSSDEAIEQVILVYTRVACRTVAWSSSACAASASSAGAGSEKSSKNDFLRLSGVAGRLCSSSGSWTTGSVATCRSSMPVPSTAGTSTGSIAGMPPAGWRSSSWASTAPSLPLDAGSRHAAVASTAAWHCATAARTTSTTPSRAVSRASNAWSAAAKGSLAGGAWPPACRSRHNFCRQERIVRGFTFRDAHQVAWSRPDSCHSVTSRRRSSLVRLLLSITV
jgi:hypothetical protein